MALERLILSSLSYLGCAIFHLCETTIHGELSMCPTARDYPATTLFLLLGKAFQSAHHAVFQYCGEVIFSCYAGWRLKMS